MDKLIQARTALKSSFLSEIAMITRDQVCFEDVRTIGNVTCEDFSVDDLLDFSDKDFEEGSFQESEEDEAKDTSESSNQLGSVNYSSTDNNVVFGDLPVGELSIPVDEMENLEWLSQIEDDASVEASLLCPVGNFSWNTGSFRVNRGEPVGRPVAQRVQEPCFPMPVCKKPRGKRPRPNGKVISPFLFAEPVQQVEWFSTVGEPVVKKQKKKNAEENGPAQMVRRCSHCQVQKTPQWRAGPLGPKTLCNACGVRFKSGRLFPEYRPACSPTFSQEAHSNSHRKVLEMRRKKEVVGGIETGLSPMVKSF